ncbi:hypothetical protein H1S01_05630 [Heliobacterium chlorum]|uniref:Uncharacterized protein n=1 Tax=Heliobacterium chlorum TaxID=2698 RepID=A0ABR7SZX8_HELCL|nr:hypothetical protein [Heliobacterium chlorum]MBC9783991.1 hypothetical protein [Heliobacterium chlorum]
MGWFNKKEKSPEHCGVPGIHFDECPGCGLDVKAWFSGKGGEAIPDRCPRCNALLRPPMGCGGCGNCGNCSK